MSINSIVSMAVNMQAQSVREQASMSVTKMALDRMEQTGQEITEMLGSSNGVSLDSSLGNMVDVSV